MKSHKSIRALSEKKLAEMNSLLLRLLLLSSIPGWLRSAVAPTVRRIRCRDGQTEFGYFFGNVSVNIDPQFAFVSRFISFSLAPRSAF